MPEKIRLPDGRYVEIPDDASPEFRAELDRQIGEMFPQAGPAPQQPEYGSAEWYRSESARIDAALGRIPQYQSDPMAEVYDPPEVGEGTVLGSAWEGIKSIPRGVRQFGIMAQQGWEGIQTPDEDTDREKELRQRMEDLMLEIDPKYRDSNLVNVGMGLGQVAGMIGLGAGATALGATGVGAGIVAGGATALMGAGEQASRIAEFEERTGQDVSAAKEQQALALGLGIGLTEMLPLGKFARALGVSKAAGATMSEALVDSAADLTNGKILRSMMRQAGEEALQEGTAGFAQSATARYLYDDEALADAGVEALREAMVGGQVGAITDAVIKMSTRAIGNRRGGRGDYLLDELLSKKQQERINRGVTNTKEIDDLITGAETDPALAELRDSLIDIDADGNVTVKEGEGTLIGANKRRTRTELSDLRDAFDRGEFGDPKTAEAKAAYHAEIEPVHDRAANFNREIAKLIAGYKAQAEGTLGVNLDEQKAEEELSGIRATILPEEVNPENKQEFVEQNTYGKTFEEWMQDLRQKDAYGDLDAGVLTEAELREMYITEMEEAGTEPRFQEIIVDDTDIDAPEEERGAPGVSSSFTTARGSTYEVQPDGTTVRQRISDEEAGKTQQFESQEASKQTYFVSPENVRRLRYLQAIHADDVSMIVAEMPGLPGMIGLKAASGPQAGKWATAEMRTDGKSFEEWMQDQGDTELTEAELREAYIRESFVPYTTNPEVGLHPVETWVDQRLKGDALAKEALSHKLADGSGNQAHFGNVITQVGDTRQKRTRPQRRRLDRPMKPYRPLPTLETVGPEPQIPIEEIAAQLEARLGKKDREIALEEAEKIQTAANEAARQLLPLNQQIKTVADKLKQAESRELSDLRDRFEDGKIDEETYKAEREKIILADLREEKNVAARREIERLKGELSVINNGVEATLPADTNRQDAIDALHVQFQDGKINEETYKAEMDKLLEADDDLTTAAEEAIVEETLGIYQLEALPDINLNTKGATTAENEISESWSQPTENRKAYTFEEVLELRANQARLRNLKEQRTKVEEAIQSADPIQNVIRLEAQLESLETERQTIMDGDQPQWRLVTVAEMAKRGIDKYVKQLKDEKETVAKRLHGEAIRAGLKNKDYTNYIESGKEDARIGQSPVRMIVAGASALTDPARRKIQEQIAIRRAREVNDVRLDTPIEGRQPGIGQARYQLEQRLATEGQRTAYRELVDLLKRNQDLNKKLNLSSSEARAFLEAILVGDADGGLLTKLHNVGLTEDALQRIGASARKPPKKASRARYDSDGKLRRAEARDTRQSIGQSELILALDSLFGFGAINTIDAAFDGVAYDKPPPRHWIGLSLGKLADIEFIKLRKKIEKQNFNIEIEDLAEVIRIRGFTVPKNLATSKFLNELILDSLGTTSPWQDLHRGEKEVILARLLSPPVETTTQAGTSLTVQEQRDRQNVVLREAAREERERETVSGKRKREAVRGEPLKARKAEEQQVKRMELKVLVTEIQDGDASQSKPTDQVVNEAKNIRESDSRITLFKEALQKKFNKLGLGDLSLQFMADADSVFSDVKDVIINGAFVTDANGELVLNDQGKPIYRPAFEGGAVASLQNYGTRVMFNLSQIANKYGDNWVDKIDTIVEDITVHEGSHVHFIRNNLTTTERRALKTFGRKEGRVPASIDQSAHDRKLTWEQFVKETYPELTEDNLIEETSVQILDALVSGKLAPKQTAGTIGKIKRQLSRMFGAIAESVAEAELVPVLQAFEKIQNVTVMKERSDKRRSAQGLPSLQFVDRAKQEDLQALREAVAEGDPKKIDAAAQTILESREEFKDDRTDLERLQESLVSELRARRDIEMNPSYAYAPELNKEAIESGRVTPESLNAYFRFTDGREAPFRMPPKDMDMRKKRNGRDSIAYTEADLSLIDRIKASGRVLKSDVSPAEGILKGMNYFETWKDKSGRERTVREEKDFTEMLDYTTGEMLIKRFFDKNIPMWKSHKRGLRREIAEYGNALTRLAESSAIAAWRIAANAMNFIPMVMEHGPIVYINGGFIGGQKNPRYAIDINTGDFRLDADGKKIPVKGLRIIYNQLLEVGVDTIDVATDYMAALRILDVRKKREEAKAVLRQVLADPTGEITLDEAIKEVDTWTDAYDRTNPMDHSKGTRFYPYQEALKRKKEVEALGDDMGRAVTNFAQEYADFNYYQIEFAMDTGLLSRDEGKIMQSMAYVPFYRDQGWQSTSPMENLNNKNIERTNKEAENKIDDDDFVARGAPLLDKAIRGSFLPISGDLLANLQKNAQAIVRDGMNNVAITRTMRDELANGTAIEIKTATAAEYARSKFLKQKLDEIKDRRASKSKEENLADQLQNIDEYKIELAMQEEYAVLSKKIKQLENDVDALHAELDEKGFSKIIVRAKGVSTGGNLDTVVPEVIDPNTGLPQTKSSPSVLEEGGVAKAYRVLDPELSRAIMDIGFSPQKSIEEFFSKTLGSKSDWVNKGAAKLLVTSSEFLREAVTRSPAFMLKNIIRDSFQASVIYGGGPKLVVKAMKNALFTPNLVEDAEARGLGIAVDYQPDDQETRWHSSIPFVGTLWNQLGHMSKRSEVATRMAIYDHTMNLTDGNAAESLYQAIEIINYGRRGSSRLFSTLAAMAPFVNGRMQGLHVLFRNHTGALDAPGLFLEEGSKMDAGAERWARAKVAMGRGLLIATGTLVYYMAMKDDEEYKNAREDMKADWWLFPLGAGKDGEPRPGFKMPIPFEVGLFYKVIPEQIFRVIAEEEHDLSDMTEEMRRQLIASLWFDFRPQLIRPIIDAAANHDAYQRDLIVPQWMEETVAASEHYNPYTNQVAKLIGQSLSKIPLVNNLEFLTSPMKLEYMMRQYTGSIGAYVMLLTDRVVREAMNENVVGTASDFGSISQPISSRTFAQIPVFGDLFYDPAKGGGYQEDFYEMKEQLDFLITTVGQIRENEGYQAALEFEEKHQPMFRAKSRLQNFDRRMKHYRLQRDRLFNRNDLSKEDKRRQLFRMFETRDDMLEEMLQIMADIRREKTMLDKVIGG